MSYKRCLQCEKPMRPYGVLSKDAPGTVATGGHGICNSCQAKNRREYGPNYQPTRKRQAQEATQAAAPGLNVASSSGERTSPGITRGGYNDFPSVLVRLDLRPSTFRALRRAKVDIHAELSKYADKLADEVGGLGA